MIKLPIALNHFNHWISFLDAWLYFLTDILNKNHCDEYEQRKILHFYKYLLVWKDVGGHDTLLEYKKLNKTFVWLNFHGNYSYICINIR